MLFVDYIKQVQSSNLYPYHEKKYETYKSYPILFFYGPPGTGKYSQALYFLRTITGSTLQYEKKMLIELPKFDFMIKMSDVHYEIDMALLAYSNKTVWHSIYKHIVEVDRGRRSYIVLKHFDKITPEILDILYFYIHDNRMKFLCITEHLSFIPNNILNEAYSVSFYHKSVIRVKDTLEQSSITKERLYETKNIHYLRDNLQVKEYNLICDPILQSIQALPKHTDIRQFRNQLYNILIYGLDVYECIWYILDHLHISDDHKMVKIIQEVDTFGKFFQNNYRPIYHLEKIFLYIACIYHEIPTSTEVTRFS